MRLPDFIEANLDQVLDEWVTFARKREGAESMHIMELRDHAAEMLRVIAADMRIPETANEQFVKSQGETPQDESAAPTAAQKHGSGRADSGFSVIEMMAEFRALRASVLHLWTASMGSLTGPDLHDLIRFNEAIDQAIAESVGQYASTIDQWRDTFVAIVCHDLRTPLNALSLTIQHVLQSPRFDLEFAQLLARAVRSAERMTLIIDDLLDFTQSRLGQGLVLDREAVDVASVVMEVVEEMRRVSPHNRLHVELHGDLRGQWDSARTARLLSNLIGNAVQHGAANAPVHIEATGATDSIVLTVRNRGPAIPQHMQAALFSPLARLQRSDNGDKTRHLGLGLYICEQIAAAHGGHIAVTSSDEEGTCFTVYLPCTDEAAWSEHPSRRHQAFSR